MMVVTMIVEVMIGVDGLRQGVVEWRRRRRGMRHDRESLMSKKQAV